MNFNDFIKENPQFFEPEDVREKLFHFTSLENFWKIWCTQKLLLFPGKNMNDFTENNRIATGQLPFQARYAYAFLDGVNEYKQLSLSKDYSDNHYVEHMCYSPTMWGLYANKATGVCIELVRENLNIPKSMIQGNVSYVDYIPCLPDLPSDVRFNSSKDVRLYVDERIQSIFFQKYKDWSFENELRLISRTCNSLSIENAVSTIYLCNTDETSYNLVQTLIDCMPISNQPKIKILYSSANEGKREIKSSSDPRLIRKTHNDFLAQEQEMAKQIMNR